MSMKAFTVDVVDVDADADLVARYDELVPVLLGSKNGRTGKANLPLFP